MASGRIPGPRILPSRPILCQTGGHGYIGGMWEPPAEYEKRDIPGLRSNADIVGIADEVGTVQAGKRADLVVFDGNPLDDPKIFADTNRGVLVIQNGKVVVDRRRT